VVGGIRAITSAWTNSSGDFPAALALASTSRFMMMVSSACRFIWYSCSWNCWSSFLMSPLAKSSSSLAEMTSVPIFATGAFGSAAGAALAWVVDGEVQASAPRAAATAR
jgi:hypothetical protein